MELQLTHAELQAQALTAQEQQLRGERDSLQYALAAAEQDKLLLETRLLEVAGFEGFKGNKTLGGGAPSLEAVRGKLLTVANQRVRSFSFSVRPGRLADVLLHRECILHTHY